MIDYLLWEKAPIMSEWLIKKTNTTSIVVVFFSFKTNRPMTEDRNLFFARTLRTLEERFALTAWRRRKKCTNLGQCVLRFAFFFALQTLEASRSALLISVSGNLGIISLPKSRGRVLLLLITIRREFNLFLNFLITGWASALCFRCEIAFSRFWLSILAFFVADASMWTCIDEYSRFYKHRKKSMLPPRCRGCHFYSFVQKKCLMYIKNCRAS